MNKIIRKKLFFSFVTFIILLLLFEVILGLGSYFYFYIYSNLDRPKIEEDAFRILFLGESTTMGGGLKSGEYTYATQIENILQQEYPNKEIKSYNKGVGTIETTAILRNLARNIIKYKPNLIILMAGYNDHFVSDDKLHTLKYLYSKSKLYRLTVSIVDYFKIAKTCPECPEGDFRYIAKGSYFYKPINLLSQVTFNLNAIIDTVHSYGSEIWFAGYLQPDARDKVNPVLKKIAEENDIIYTGDYPIVDFGINRSLFSEDGWHPSEEGHRIIAEKIAERIIQEGIIDRWQPS